MLRAGGDEAIVFSRVTDGTSNTVFIVDVKPESAVPWTSPEDYDFDPENPAAGCAIATDEVFVAAMVDGSVHALPGDLPAETLLHLFQMNDGHATQW